MLGILELYCGIGGVAAVLRDAAVGDAAQIVAAVDVDADCLEVYRHNFPHPVVRASVESLTTRRFRAWDADLWWLSPPSHGLQHPSTRQHL